MTKENKMDILKTIISMRMDVDIMRKSRQREIISGRKVFAKILTEQGFTRVEIGKYLRKDHSTIVHYIADVDHMIKYTEGMSEKYLTCRRLFAESIGEKIDDRGTLVGRLKTRIDELNVELERLKRKVDMYKRLDAVVRLIDSRTPNDKEDFILIKINSMFNSIAEYDKSFR